jgi:hypothetical protein
MKPGDENSKKVAAEQNSLQDLLKLQDKNQQQTLDKLEQLEAHLKHNTSIFTQQTESCVKENQRLLNTVIDERESQTEQISYLEKKLDYIDKTIDLRIKHFDELLKNSQEQYEKNVKNIQDDIRYQIERIANMETKLSSLRYLYIGIGVIVVVLVWVLMSRISVVNKLDLAESKKLSEQIVLTLKEDNRETLQTLIQQNNNLLEAIRKDNNELLKDVQQSSKQQNATIQKENKRLLGLLQEDNQLFLAAIQQSNQEQMADIMRLISPATGTPSQPEPIPGEHTDDTEVTEPTTTDEFP